MMQDLFKYFIDFTNFILNIELLPNITIYQILIFGIIVTIITLGIKALIVNK